MGLTPRTPPFSLSRSKSSSEKTFIDRLRTIIAPSIGAEALFVLLFSGLEFIGNVDREYREKHHPAAASTTERTSPVTVLAKIFDPTVVTFMNAHHTASPKVDTEGLTERSTIKKTKLAK